MDYFNSLSPDIASRILSFTSTPTISRCTRLCRVTRNFINSTPILHQEVDLSQLDRKEDLPLILYELQKRSILSSNTIKSVSINLAFVKQGESDQEQESRDAWSEWEDRISGLHQTSPQDYTLDGIHSIIKALYPSRSSLESLSFRIPKNHELNLERITFLIQTFDKDFPGLRSVCFYVPDGLEDLECEFQNLRRVVIKNDHPNSKVRTTQYSDKEMIPLLQTIQAFCRGQGLKHFLMDDIPETSSRWECPRQVALLGTGRGKVLEELKKSRLTLQKLDLGSIYTSHPQAALDFILSCPNLEILGMSFDHNYSYYDPEDAYDEYHARLEEGEDVDSNLGMDPDSDDDNFSDSGLIVPPSSSNPVKTLQFPSNVASTSNLKHLFLTMNAKSFRLDDPMIKWIGNKLETLHIKEKAKSSSPAVKEKQLFKLLKQCQSSLKSIKFENLWVKTEAASSTKGRKKGSVDLLKFTNLEHLHVHQSPAFSLETVDARHLCNLRSLWFNGCLKNNPFIRRSWDEKEPSVLLSPFMSILKYSRMTLETVHLEKIQFKVAAKCRREAIEMEGLGLRLPNLKTLELQELRPFEPARRFTSLRYPRLEKVYLDSKFCGGVNSFTFEHFCFFIKRHRASLRSIKVGEGSAGECLGRYIHEMESYSFTFPNVEELHLCVGERSEVNSIASGRVGNFFLEARYPKLLRENLLETKKSFDRATRPKRAYEATDHEVWLGRVGEGYEDGKEAEEIPFEERFLAFINPMADALGKVAERLENW